MAGSMFQIQNVIVELRRFKILGTTSDILPRFYIKKKVKKLKTTLERIIIIRRQFIL